MWIDHWSGSSLWDRMPGNRGIAGFADSKSWRRADISASPTPFFSSELNQGSPVCARSRTPLALVEQEVVRVVADEFDANLPQVFNYAGLYSRQVSDVVVRVLGIQAVKELASDGSMQ